MAAKLRKREVNERIIPDKKKQKIEVSDQNPGNFE